MTTDQWELVPDSVLRDGPKLLAWIDARGIRKPLLVDIEAERGRRGLTKRPNITPERQVLLMPTTVENTTAAAARLGLPILRVIAGRPTIVRPSADDPRPGDKPRPKESDNTR